MSDTRTPAERAYDAQRDGSAYTKPTANQDAAHAWELIQQITDNPTDDGRDAEAAEDTDEIIKVLRQLDDGREC